MTVTRGKHDVVSATQQKGTKPRNDDDGEDVHSSIGRKGEPRKKQLHIAKTRGKVSILLTYTIILMVWNCCTVCIRATEVNHVHNNMYMNCFLTYARTTAIIIVWRWEKCDISNCGDRRKWSHNEDDEQNCSSNGLHLIATESCGIFMSIIILAPFIWICMLIVVGNYLQFDWIAWRSKISRQSCGVLPL